MIIRIIIHEQLLPLLNKQPIFFNPLSLHIMFLQEFCYKMNIKNIKEKNKSENILKEKSMSYDFDFNNYKKYGGRDYPDMNGEDYDYEFSDDFDFADFEDDIFGL